MSAQELSQAIGSGNHKKLEAIIHEGIDLEMMLDQLGMPHHRALGLAASVGNLKAVEILLAAGAQVDGLCAGGRNTPLMEAAANGKKRDVKVAEKLLAAGADVNHKLVSIKGTVSSTPLFTAARMAKVEFIQCLIDHGAEVDYMTSRGTALMRAARDGRVDAVEVLLDAGADPQLTRPETDMTALEIAKEAKKRKVVAYLEAHT